MPDQTSITNLPEVGQEFEGGKFAGVITLPDGQHVAITLLPDQASNVNWDNANKWAAQLNAVLPTRPIAALLFANLQPYLRPQWHWTSEAHSASFAWGCYCSNGYTDSDHKSYEGSAVAVRCIHLVSFLPTAMTTETPTQPETLAAQMPVNCNPAATTLQPGERYAGVVLDADGNVKHHLVLLPARPEKRMNWQAAIDWAASMGGQLPDRQEQSLLFANCKPHLPSGGWHWSCESREEDASYAWSCFFDDGGYPSHDHKSYEGSAVAVRRFVS